MSCLLVPHLCTIAGEDMQGNDERNANSQKVMMIWRWMCLLTGMALLLAELRMVCGGCIVKKLQYNRILPQRKEQGGI